MKKQSLIILYLFLNLSCAVAGILGPSNYDDCILDGVKSARTDLAVRAVYQSCRNKFPDSSNSNIIKNCSVVWTGREFIKGTPENPLNFQKFEIANSIVVGYLPKDSPQNANYVSDNINVIKKLCPYF